MNPHPAIRFRICGRCSCPMCGNAKANGIAKQTNGRLDEPMPGEVA